MVPAGGSKASCECMLATTQTGQWPAARQHASAAAHVNRRNRRKVVLWCSTHHTDVVDVSQQVQALKAIRRVLTHMRVVAN
jgi:hypothetical protein